MSSILCVKYTFQVCRDKSTAPLPALWGNSLTQNACFSHLAPKCLFHVRIYIYTDISMDRSGYGFSADPLKTPSHVSWCCKSIWQAVHQFDGSGFGYYEWYRFDMLYARYLKQQHFGYWRPFILRPLGTLVATRFGPDHRSSRTNVKLYRSFHYNCSSRRTPNTFLFSPSTPL